MWPSLLLLLLPGCGESLPDRLDQCPDQACQQLWVESRWATDPEAVARAIGALPDPLARVALVRQLTDAHPGEAKPLCDLLPEGDPRQACHTRNMRPHLQQVEVRSTAKASTDQDSDGHGFRIQRAIPSPWERVSPQAADCAVEERSCQNEAARQRAARGDLEGAAASCAALSDATWRAECYFQAAEAASQQPGAAGGQAVSLCLGAASFAGRCLSHLVRNLGTQAPRAASGDTTRWQALVEAIAAGRETLADADADLAEQYEGQAWAYALRFAYSQESEVNAAPLDVLPEPAFPHVRAAMAWRLWSQEGLQERTLAAWETRIEEALADRAPRHSSRSSARRDLSPIVRDYWARILPDERGLTRVPYLGPAERALAEDPLEDATICLVEAAARSQPPAKALLAEALSHKSSLVRWTAARLLSTVDPRNHALNRGDADPMVRARLRQP